MKIKHVYGNVLKLDIPLTIKIRTMEGDVPTEREEPFYPDAAKGCIVELANNYNRKIRYDATVSGNVAHIEDDGIISIGTYKVTVKCHDEYGNPYRYMVRDIIEICDATIDAGIEAGVEFNAETYTLEGAVFISYGGEQVQSDWAETDPEEKSFIKNKPDLSVYATKEELENVESEIPELPENLVTDANYVHTDNNYTTEEKQKLANAITEEQDPTVPQWAKQPNKPSYTPQEVGALPANTPLFDGDYNSLTNKPDLSGYITISVNNLVNYYLKSEVYTKTEVANLIAAIQQFHYEIYASTSAVTSPAGNVLYLIGPTGTGADKYEEYVYDATKQEPWVKIGDTSIDLSGYYTSQQTDAAITSALNTALADYTTTANLTTLLAGKQDVINDLAAIRSGAAAGATAYQKPQAGIPKTDLAQGVQDSLDLADTALQEDTLYEDANGHDYVEIAGMKWATKNVGADAVTDAGLYFQWGDTQGYTAEQVGSGEGQKFFGWADYKYGNGTSSPGATGMTKYNSTDGKTILDLEDDSARANWGGTWRMPTTEEMQAFGAAVNAVWTDDYQGSGVAGLVCTDKTDNTKVVFFPAAGYCNDGSVDDVSDYGYYWSSSLYSDDVEGGFQLYFNYVGVYWDGGSSSRCYGYPVRPILDTTQMKKDLDSKQDRPFVIEVNNGDTTVPSGTYASITTALAEGREVMVKYNDGSECVYYLPFVRNDDGYYFSGIVEDYSVCVSVYYDETINIYSIGLQSRIDPTHKLDADLVDDTNTTNKFTNATEKQTWNNKQDALVSGTNIKTINNESILGSGNITIQGGGGSQVQSDWNQTDTDADDYIKNKPTIPDVPSWALAPTKPTYTADEVGAIPNAELFYGSRRQGQINYVNLFCDALWSASKRWNVSVSVVNSSGETVSPMVYSPDGLFNINYEDQSLRISSGTTAKILIKGGDDIDDNSSRMFTYGLGYIYVHFYSKIEYLPNSISGRVYTHYNNIGWTNITFSAMTDYQDLRNVYKAEVPGSIAYPSALEITVEARNSQYTSVCEIEWWTKRQNMGDVPVFSKARAETLFQPLTLKEKLTVNNKVEANQFAVLSSNNNYVLLGGGGTKALTQFFSGNYNDLTNKPTIPTVPTNVSAFTNDAGYLTQHQDISGKADKSEMSVVDGTGANADKTTITLKNGTSATVLKSHQDISGKQDTLVSGTNIKTINNQSLLGSGNINIDISGKEDVTTIVAPVNTTDSTLPITALTCEVGKYYRIDVAVETLAITLPAMSDLTTVRTVVIYLTAGTTPAVTISSTAVSGGTAPDVYYQDGFEIEAGNTYEINALWNGVVWVVATVNINTSNS